MLVIDLLTVRKQIFTPPIEIVSVLVDFIILAHAAFAIRSRMKFMRVDEFSCSRQNERYSRPRITAHVPWRRHARERTIGFIRSKVTKQIVSHEIANGLIEKRQYVKYTAALPVNVSISNSRLRPIWFDDKSPDCISEKNRSSFLALLLWTYEIFKTAGTSIFVLPLLIVQSPVRTWGDKAKFVHRPFV